MSDDDQNPELDPSWERTKLLTTLEGMYRTQIGTAALHMKKDLTAVMVWAGRVAPPEGEEAEGPTTFTIQVSDLYLSLTAVQIVLDYVPDEVYGYSISPAGPFEELNQDTAELDEYFSDLIERSTFEPDAAQAALNRLFPRRRRRRRKGRGGPGPRPNSD